MINKTIMEQVTNFHYPEWQLGSNKHYDPQNNP
jgi:hypothetical protein